VEALAALGNVSILALKSGARCWRMKSSSKVRVVKSCIILQVFTFSVSITDLCSSVGSAEVSFAGSGASGDDGDVEAGDSDIGLQ
jgi:hypothetical protein